MADDLGIGTPRVITGQGHYHESYEKLDGEWRIKTTRLARLVKVVTRTYVDGGPTDGGPNA